MSKSKVIVEYGTLDDYELPPIVYKYRFWGNEFHKRFISHREVFLASPKTFEDELDCHNPTRFDLLTKQQIFDYFIWHSKKENLNYTRQQHRNFARYWSKVSAINDTEYVKKFMANSIKQYYEHEGILSLTENWDNQEMWNKYSDSEKGFCIGYNTRIMFEYLGGGGPVNYVDKIPDILPEPFMGFGEAMRNRVYYKLKKWEFEQEYRTKMFWPKSAGIKDRQIVLPKEAFEKVIIGNKMNLDVEHEIRNKIQKHLGDIEIVKRINAS